MRIIKKMSLLEKVQIVSVQLSMSVLTKSSESRVQHTMRHMSKEQDYIKEKDHCP